MRKIDESVFKDIGIFTDYKSYKLCWRSENLKKEKDTNFEFSREKNEFDTLCLTHNKDSEDYDSDNIYDQLMIIELRGTKDNNAYFFLTTNISDSPLGEIYSNIEDAKQKALILREKGIIEAIDMARPSATEVAESIAELFERAIENLPTDHDPEKDYVDLDIPSNEIPFEEKWAGVISKE